MIKFFRKIRYDLMEKNKTGKYLKYAIGEIVLVVIGILIALAISNWNSNRIQKDRNQQLLVKLSKELDQNIERCKVIDTITLGFKDRQQFTDSTLKILNRGVTLEDLDFLIKKDRIYYTVTLNLNTNIFEELKNTGSLYAIGSDSLVSQIQNYYQLCKRESFYNLEIGKTVVNLQEKCFEGFYAFMYLYQQNPTKAIAQHDWIFDPSSKDYIYFQQFIDKTKAHSNMMVWKLSQIVQASRDLKQLITAEIDK
jgi:hypothetical protein